MKHLGIAVIAIVAASLGLGLGASHAAGTPFGNWTTPPPNVGVVQIFPCGTSLCGKIVGTVQDSPASPAPKTWQGRPECNFTFIRTKPIAGANPAAWDGTITDPRNGSVYSARISMGETGQLRLRGYLIIPLLGETQIWHAYTGKLALDCRMTAGTVTP